MSKLFNSNAIQFEHSAFSIKDLPVKNLPEYAFIGRSNVGKSSLINSLCRLHKIAKVSSTPGKTVSLNYFNLDNKAFLVDLPGYGYAKLSKKDMAIISKLVGDYFNSSKNLVLTSVLIDSRHEIKAIDMDLIRVLEEIGIEVCLVLTKCDKKGKRSEYWEKQYTELQNLFSNISGLIYTSSKNKLGVKELTAFISEHYTKLKACQ